MPRNYDYSDSKYIKKYKKRMTESMLMIHPDWDKSMVEETIDSMLKDRFQNPTLELDNNYTGEHKEASLVTVMDWAIEKKPIIAGNGTFYMNQEQALNPVARMLDSMLTQRKAIKKQMFKIEDTESPEYKDLDMQQLNTKINVNSYRNGAYLVGMRTSLIAGNSC